MSTSHIRDVIDNIELSLRGNPLVYKVNDRPADRCATRKKENCGSLCGNRIELAWNYYVARNRCRASKTGLRKTIESVVVGVVQSELIDDPRADIRSEPRRKRLGLNTI